MRAFRWSVVVVLVVGALGGVELAAQAPEPPAVAGHAVAALGVRPAPRLPVHDPQAALDAAVARASLARHVGWGAALGAGAGVVTGLLVLSECDSYCDGTELQGMALHIGVGSVLGAAGGALVHWVRGS